jgi:hypothetical protein
MSSPVEDINLLRDVAATGIQRGGYAEAVARLLLNYTERIERLEAQIEKLKSEKT